MDMSTNASHSLQAPLLIKDDASQQFIMITVPPGVAASQLTASNSSISEVQVVSELPKFTENEFVIKDEPLAGCEYFMISENSTFGATSLNQDLIYNLMPNGDLEPSLPTNGALPSFQLILPSDFSFGIESTKNASESNATTTKSKPFKIENNDSSDTHIQSTADLLQFLTKERIVCEPIDAAQFANETSSLSSQSFASCSDNTNASPVDNSPNKLGAKVLSNEVDPVKEMVQRIMNKVASETAKARTKPPSTHLKSKWTSKERPYKPTKTRCKSPGHLAKGMFDKIPYLTVDQIKDQLSHTSDIVRPVEFAPPKKGEPVKRGSEISRMFTSPIRSAHCQASVLLKMFAKRLISEVKQDDGICDYWRGEQDEEISKMPTPGEPSLQSTQSQIPFEK